MPPPESFQHFQVLRRPDGSLWELGRGAMGVTYKAFDTNLRSHVALKVINAQHLDSDTSRQRFLREARAAAGMSHPNVATVFHLGESGGDYFYAMEFIDGETIESFVQKRGPLPAALALRIALQVARALRAAEKVGLVHRDIKPANLMLVHDDDGPDGADPHLKVIDFGLAKAVEQGQDAATITVAGFVGTPHFASPEQLEERDLDVRSDIYSLGITLWYMLAGKPPFGGTVARIMSQHLGAPPPFEQLAGQPPQVVALLGRMLEKDPGLRPQNASELRREIEGALGGAGPAALPPRGKGLATPAGVMQPPPLPPTTLAPTTAPPMQAPSSPAPAAVFTPPPLPPARPPGGSRTPVYAGLASALVILALAGGYLAYRYAGGRFETDKPPSRAEPAASVTPAATPSPAAPPLVIPPPPAPPTPPPVPVEAPAETSVPTPPPPSTPAPTPDRAARFREILADVQRLESAGNAGEAIDGYVRLIEDYPENTQTTARLDALVGHVDPSDPSLRAPLERAARAGSGAAMLALGDRLAGTDPAAAAEWYRQAAGQGRTEAMVALGDLSFRGAGAAADPAEAVRWYQLASNKGSAKAKVYLAECYENARGGLPRDLGRMFALLQEAEAIEPANPATRLKLALAYEHGWGTTANPKRAFDLMKGAADAGMVSALANVGSYYMRGFGTRADPRAAAVLFRQGADQNNAACQFFYAQCLEHGLGGVAADAGAATDLYRRSAVQGFAPARQWCTQHKVAVPPER